MTVVMIANEQFLKIDIFDDIALRTRMWHTMTCFCCRKLGESEAQCDALREQVKQLKAEIEQWKVGGKTASM